MLFHMALSLNSNNDIRIIPNTNTDVVTPASMSESDEGVTIHADSTAVAGGADENKPPSTKGARRDENSD